MLGIVVGNKITIGSYTSNEITSFESTSGDFTQASSNISMILKGLEWKFYLFPNIAVGECAVCLMLNH